MPERRFMKNDDIKEARKKAALDYHEFPTPGKLSITATKLAPQPERLWRWLTRRALPQPARPLSKTPLKRLSVYRAGQPGRGDHEWHRRARIGGNRAPLAAKPVMEGKAVLFKKFAGIDVFRHRSRAGAIQ